jgi:hypothetical protein
MKRNIFKQPWVLLLGIIAIGVITGFSLAGCKQDAGDDNTNGDNTNGDNNASGLLAAWYIDVNGNGILESYEGYVSAYEFKADGILLVGGALVPNMTYTVSGDKITLVTAGIPADEPITFSIAGNKLTLSGSTASGFTPGIYLKK